MNGLCIAPPFKAGRLDFELPLLKRGTFILNCPLLNAGYREADFKTNNEIPVVSQFKSCQAELVEAGVEAVQQYSFDKLRLTAQQ